MDFTVGVTVDKEQETVSREILELSEEEWDVLLYIASHIAGDQSPPTKEKVLQAGVAQHALHALVMGDLLQETNGTLHPTNKILKVTGERRSSIDRPL